MNWHALLSEAIETTGKYQKEAPDTFVGFGIMDKAAKKDGALSEKTKELIALGIAISTRCESCIGFHVESLVRLGASRDELVEALSMCSYMGGGPSITFSAKALEAFEQISKN